MKLPVIFFISESNSRFRVIDLAGRFESNQVERSVDGVHWNAFAHHRITNFIKDEINLYFNKLPEMLVSSTLIQSKTCIDHVVDDSCRKRTRNYDDFETQSMNKRPYAPSFPRSSFFQHHNASQNTFNNLINAPSFYGPQYQPYQQDYMPYTPPPLHTGFSAYSLPRQQQQQQQGYMSFTPPQHRGMYFDVRPSSLMNYPQSNDRYSY